MFLALKILVSFLVGIAYSEAVGYVVHKLLHSEHIPSLSRNHMLHHLKMYGPGMSMRSEGYKVSTDGRKSVGGVGFEWIGPIAIAVVPSSVLAYLAGIPAIFILCAFISALAWGILSFNYMHDAMHRRNFWMLKHPLLGRWFKNIRRLHDIHHVDVSSNGKMEKNFGICLFILDRIFGTFSDKARPFNEQGVRRAEERYANVIKD